MSRFVFYEDGMRYVFRSEEGPTGRYLARKAAGVTTRADQNVSGGGPGGRPRMRTKDLKHHLRFAGIFQDARGLYAVVGSDAQHDGVNYPRLLELGGIAPNGKPYRYPWLMPALRAEFGQR